MSLHTLNRAVLAAARVTFHNPKLRSVDILEWSTSNGVNIEADEVTDWASDPGVWIVIKKDKDKRP